MRSSAHRVRSVSVKFRRGSGRLRRCCGGSRLRPSTVATMGDDMRIDLLRSRQMALGCAWLFLAMPGVFGIVLLLGTGGRSVTGWILTGLYALGTLYLGILFVRASRLSVAPMENRSGWIGFRRTDR